MCILLFKVITHVLDLQTHAFWTYKLLFLHDTYALCMLGNSSVQCLVVYISLFEFFVFGIKRNKFTLLFINVFHYVNQLKVEFTNQFCLLIFYFYCNHCSCLMLFLCSLVSIRPAYFYNVLF